MECYVGTSGWSYYWNPDGSFEWFVKLPDLNAVKIKNRAFTPPIPEYGSIMLGIASRKSSRPMVANMVMPDLVIALTNIIAMVSLKRFTKASVSMEIEEVNIAAIKKGQEYVNATVRGNS